MLFLLSLLILWSFGGIFFRSEFVARQVIYGVTRFFPPHFTIAVVKGNLTDLSLRDIIYRKDDVEIRVDSASFNWSPHKLWLGILKINQLRVAGVSMHLNSTVPASSKKLKYRKIWLHYLSWLEHVRCRDFTITDITWQTANYQPIKLDNFSFSLKEQRLNLKLQSANNVLVLSGVIGNQLNLAWQITAPHLKLAVIAGSIMSQGVIAQNATAFKIKGDLKLRQLNLADIYVENFISGIDLDSSLPNSTINFTSQKISFGQILIPRWQGRWVLDMTRQQLTLFAAPLMLSSRFKQQVRNLIINEVTTVFNYRADQLAMHAQMLIAHNPLLIDWSLTKRHLALWNFTHATCQGKLTWQLNDLTFISAFFPQLKNVTGQARVEYAISNTLQEPKIIGQIAVTKVAASVIPLQLNLSDLNLLWRQQEPISLQGNVRSGKGNLQFIGKIQISPAWEFTGELQGKDFLVSNLPNYLITINPKLQFTFTPAVWKIDGSILVPEATIKLKDLRSSNTLPREVVFIDEPHADPAQSFSGSAKIQLVLGDAVAVDAFGITGLLRGHLQITDEPSRLTTADGILTIEHGSYNIYGQALTITQGELTFVTSPVTDPELNLRAIRKVNTINPEDFTPSELTVGLAAHGKVDNLQVDLFSIPSGQTKTDIFSYLVLGQPAAQASDNKMQLLLKAAQALNFSGASELSHVVTNLREKLGLSELGLTSETAKPNLTANNSATATSNPALLLGKYLSPRLYLSYSIGFLDQVNIFRARYSLGRRWAVQSESSSLGNGADLIYSVERE